MKQSIVMKQLISKVAFVLAIVLFITVSFTYYLIRGAVQAHMLEDLTETQNTVVQAMESSKQSVETIEYLIDRKLLLASKGIAQALEGKTIDEVTEEELIELKTEWDLYGISLFVREGDDIVVRKSSDENEVGLGSKDWGYWFTAFDELLDGKEVTVEPGYRAENYWVGPISRSEWEDKYYKYAYYYDENLPFLINPYIVDEVIYATTFTSGPGAMINEITANNPDIEEIAVINVEAWLKGDENDVVEPHKDLPILYGTNEFELKEDRASFQEVLQANEGTSMTFKKQGEKYKKTYFPLEQGRVLTITSNLHFLETMERKLISLIATSFVIAFIIIFFLIRLFTKKQLTPLKPIYEHLKQVSNGDLTKRLTIHTENEWGGLSESVNTMTEMIHHLIFEVKQEVQSLTILSSLLSKQMEESLLAMNDKSMMLTNDSKLFLMELQERVEDFRKKVDDMQNEIPRSSIDKSSQMQMFESIDALHHSLTHLIDYTSRQTGEMTEMTVRFLDMVSELTDAVQQLDQTAEKLKERVDVFNVKDESNS